MMKPHQEAALRGALKALNTSITDIIEDPDNEHLNLTWSPKDSMMFVKGRAKSRMAPLVNVAVSARKEFS
jgi:hypothetical protein